MQINWQSIRGRKWETSNKETVKVSELKERKTERQANSLGREEVGKVKRKRRKKNLVRDENKQIDSL